MTSELVNKLLVWKMITGFKMAKNFTKVFKFSDEHTLSVFLPIATTQ